MPTCLINIFDDSSSPTGTSLCGRFGRLDRIFLSCSSILKILFSISSISFFINWTFFWRSLFSLSFSFENEDDKLFLSARNSWDFVKILLLSVSKEIISLDFEVIYLFFNNSSNKSGFSLIKLISWIKVFTYYFYPFYFVA